MPYPSQKLCWSQDADKVYCQIWSNCPVVRTWHSDFQDYLCFLSCSLGTDYEGPWMLHWKLFWHYRQQGTTDIFWAMEVKVKEAQSCPTLCNPMDNTAHGILQARILEWVAFPFSMGSSQPRDQTQVSHVAGRFFTSWATREAQEYWSG